MARRFLLLFAMQITCALQTLHAQTFPAVATQPAFTLQRVVFTSSGPLHFSEKDLARAVDDSLAATVTDWPRNRNVTSDDLEEARLALTRFLIDKGYINSGALLPIQDFKNGVAIFQIVEGRLA